MLESLLVGFILSLFGIDIYFINAMEELFNLEVTIASYYFVFLIFGMILEILDQ